MVRVVTKYVTAFNVIIELQLIFLNRIERFKCINLQNIYIPFLKVN